MLGRSFLRGRFDFPTDHEVLRQLRIGKGLSRPSAGSPLADFTMELLGECQPTADSSIGETSGESVEFMWTLGFTGRAATNWLYFLDDEDAILIQLVIASPWTGYFVQEEYVTVEHLPPAFNLVEKASLFERSRAALEVAGNVAERAQFGVAGVAAKALAAMLPAKDAHGVSWSAKRFDLSETDDERRQGVEWHVARRVVQEVGSRLVGRIGLTFIDARLANSDSPDRGDVRIQAKCGLRLASEGWSDWLIKPYGLTDDLTLTISPKSGDRARTAGAE